MRFFIIGCTLLASVVCASNATAQAVAAAAPAASQPAETPPEDKVICHRIQDPGSLTTHKVCEKQSVMDLNKQNALQDAGRAQQAAHMHPVPGSGS